MIWSDKKFRFKPSLSVSISVFESLIVDNDSLSYISINYISVMKSCFDGTKVHKALSYVTLCWMIKA